MTHYPRLDLRAVLAEESSAFDDGLSPLLSGRRVLRVLGRVASTVATEEFPGTTAHAFAGSGCRTRDNQIQKTQQ
jgi:hypothetical protein